MRTQRLSWMILIAICLHQAGCLQAEDVPLADAGMDDLGPEDLGELDPSLDWPAVVHDAGRRIAELYPCESALLWVLAATQDSLGNYRNDAEVWAWAVGGSPQVLSAHLRTAYLPLVGCHEGFAYWHEADVERQHSLHRRNLSASGPAALVRTGGQWTMGEEGRLTRWLPSDNAIEMLNVDDSTVTLFSLEGMEEYEQVFQTRATRDFLYVTSQGAHRIAYAPDAEWSPVPGDFMHSVFAPVLGRLVTTQAEGPTVVKEVQTDGSFLTVAVSRECARAGGGPYPTVSTRGTWLLWNFVSLSTSECLAEVGRSAVDEQGNVHVQRLPELTEWAAEMVRAVVPETFAPIRVMQFGQQIAFVDMVEGTIRLTDEPPFPCIDPTLPCPEGAECATTRCADLPD